jgi:hypothetical protein
MELVNISYKILSLKARKGKKGYVKFLTQKIVQAPLTTINIK